MAGENTLRKNSEENSLECIPLSATQHEQLLTQSRAVLHSCIQAMGGATRPGQEKMLEGVCRAIATTHPYLVQAGTGTGKSLAYLIPACLSRELTGGPSVIATSTLALQRQIVALDASRVNAALEENDLPCARIEVFKGWNNYACMAKLALLESGEEESLFDNATARYGATHTGKELMRIAQWAQHTTSGDRDDLSPGVDDRIWSFASMTRGECPGRKCPLYEGCFAHLARLRAQEADVIVTNHAMVAIESAGHHVLPDHSNIFIDEAHDLSDSVTSHLTIMVNAARIARVLKACEKIGVDTLGFRAAHEECEQALQQMSPGLLTELPLGIAQSLENVAGAAAQSRELARSLMPKEGEEEDTSLTLNVMRAVHSLDSLIEDTREIASDSHSRITWAENREDITLVSAPENIARQLAQLWEKHRVVLTSATLNVGGNFSHTARRVGLADFSALSSQAPTEMNKSESESGSKKTQTGKAIVSHEFTSEDVGSPFDYAAQSILYVPLIHPPGPSRLHEEQLEELLSLVQASDGGALILLTAKASVEQTAEFLRASTNLPLFVQGEGHVPDLIEKFRADPRACLVGTRSLWQGVDIPGLTLRLVIIDRIPFPHRDDPLVQARERIATKHKKNSFVEVFLAPASLTLAQGAGRLIRSSEDKGVVAILDSRIVNKRYGSYVHRSLPPFFPTTNREYVEENLRALARKIN